MLTKEQIEQATAGRELDAWVAEYVMGWQWDERRCRICGAQLFEWFEDGCTKNSCSLRPAPRHHADEPPFYSTDITAAWQVVEEVHGPVGRYVDVRCGPISTVCEIMNGGMVALAWGRGDTAPEAICKAALLAVIERWA